MVRSARPVEPPELMADRLEAWTNSASTASARFWPDQSEGHLVAAQSDALYDYAYLASQYPENPCKYTSLDFPYSSCLTPLAIHSCNSSPHWQLTRSN